MPYIPTFARSLDGILRKHITTATAVLSLVVGVTGVILFFHLARGTVEFLHEWIGMIFAAIAILHVIRHRSSFANLLRQPRTHLLAGLLAMGVAAFAIAMPTPPPNPVHQLAQVAQSAPISRLAPMIGLNDRELLNRLQAGGIPATDPAQSLAAIASAHHVELMRVTAVALGTPPQTD